MHTLLALLEIDETSQKELIHSSRAPIIAPIIWETLPYLLVWRPTEIMIVTPQDYIFAYFKKLLPESVVSNQPETKC